jgi:hypothetical protein
MTLAEINAVAASAQPEAALPPDSPWRALAHDDLELLLSA